MSVRSISLDPVASISFDAQIYRSDKRIAQGSNRACKVRYSRVKIKRCPDRFRRPRV